MMPSLAPCLFFLQVLSVFTLASGQEGSKPNVLVVMTDEHNLRTIGKYRELLKATGGESQAYVWGQGVEVLTENLDSLAEGGAMFSNFYASSPVCTMSRGSFISGTYPRTNGATGNSIAMNSDALSFAEPMRNAGYRTGYIGKWHLNGNVKGRKNFGAPEGRSFGFEDTTYLWNRGHWKCFRRNKGQVTGFTWNQCMKNQNLSKKLETNYATDFLTTKAINFMKEKHQNNEAFALMLSIPDPHSPNKVRPPYDEMYSHLNFKMPETAKMAVRKKPAIPSWSYVHKNYRNVPYSISEAKIQQLENTMWFQNQNRKIFGMVKLVDDSIGRILKFLNDTGLEDNTIVVFTSDHGDLMHEHGKIDKVLPYKTSASVPMLVKWPGKIKAGKIIQSAYSSIDFAPTILSLVGIDHSNIPFQGIDGSSDLLNDEMLVSSPSQTRFIDAPGGRYVAAVTERYKLILNKKTSPWLFDMVADPDEIYDYYKRNSEYDAISMQLQSAAETTMEKYEFGLLERDTAIYLDRPACEESINVIQSNSMPPGTCKDLHLQPSYCSFEEISDACPVTCETCADDSSGHMIYLKDNITCAKEVQQEPDKFCMVENINLFCLDTCSNYPV